MSGKSKSVTLAVQRCLPRVLLHVFGADLVPEATLPDVLGMRLSLTQDFGNHVFRQRTPAHTVPTAGRLHSCAA